MNMKFTEKKAPKGPSYPMLVKHKEYGVVMLAFDRNRGIVVENCDTTHQIGDFIDYQNFGTGCWERIHGTIEF